MTKIRIRCLVAALAYTFCASGAWPVRALPTSTPGMLPLTEADEQAVSNQLGLTGLFALTDILAKHTVYEDSENRPGATLRTYYHAPYFSADPGAARVGEQVIDRESLRLLDLFDSLLVALRVSPRRLSRLEILALEYGLLVRDTTSVLDRRAVKAGALQTLAPPSAENPWQDALRAQQNELAMQLQQLPAAELRRLSDGVTAVAQHVGVVRAEAATRDAAALLDYLTQIRAHLAGLTYGVRRAAFISGLTQGEAELLSLYRQLRPDVSLRALPVTQLFVTPVAMATTQAGILSDRVLGSELIRSVNRASSGVCGHLDTCSVVIEYTELGARSALLSSVGAALMPVIFSGDVACAGKPFGPLAPPVSSVEARLAQDGELRALLYEPVQHAPRAAGEYSLTLSVKGVAREGDLLSALDQPISMTAHGPALTTNARKPFLLTSVTERLYFDGFPLVCFAERAGLWTTHLIACGGEPRQTGTQISLYDDIMRRQCSGKTLIDCVSTLESPVVATPNGP